MAGMKVKCKKRNIANAYITRAGMDVHPYEHFIPQIQRLLKFLELCMKEGLKHEVDLCMYRHAWHSLLPSFALGEGQERQTHTLRKRPPQAVVLLSLLHNVKPYLVLHLR